MVVERWMGRKWVVCGCVCAWEKREWWKWPPLFDDTKENIKKLMFFLRLFLHLLMFFSISGFFFFFFFQILTYMFFFFLHFCFFTFFKKKKPSPDLSDLTDLEVGPTPSPEPRPGQNQRLF